MKFHSVILIFLSKKVFNSFSSSVTLSVSLLFFISALSMFFFRYGQMTGDPNAVYLSVAIATSASIFWVVPFFFQGVGPQKAMFFLLGNAVATILIFAGIYRGFGLDLGHLDSSGISTISAVDWDTSLYFSIVTWTTLGYGDIKPPEAIRLVAATQAILGYMYLGLIVSILGSEFLRRDQTNRTRV